MMAKGESRLGQGVQLGVCFRFAEAKKILRSSANRDQIQARPGCAGEAACLSGTQLEKLSLQHCPPGSHISAQQLHLVVVRA